jgi:hypothetical protein
MAIRLLVPWWNHLPGDVVELGEAFDAKMIAKGKGEKVVTPKMERAVIKPKEVRDGRQ